MTLPSPAGKRRSGEAKESAVHPRLGRGSPQGNVKPHYWAQLPGFYTPPTALQRP